MDEKEKKVADEQEKEYADSFDAAAQDNPVNDKKEDPKPEDKKPEDKKEEKPDENPDDNKEENPDKKENPKPEDNKEDDAPTDKAGQAKALKDTKAWATKLAQENAELKKLLESGATKKDVDDKKASIGEMGKQLKDKLEKVYEDYPELKDVLDPMITITESLSGEFKELKKNSEEITKKEQAKAYFEKEVAPKITKDHPDFWEVAFSKEYMEWIKTQPPAIQMAATQSLDPRDISYTLTEFKKSKAAGDVEKKINSDAERKEGVKKNLTSLRGGGSSDAKKAKPTKLEDVDPNDGETAFDVAAETMK